jgi:GTPase SAR1 family protein
MDANIWVIINTILTATLVALGTMVMFVIRNRSEKSRQDELIQREKDRELEKEEREKDREQALYLRQLEHNLHTDRMSVYFEILQPFIFALSSNMISSKNREHKGKSNTDIAQEILLDMDYKKVGFKLALLGDDNVVTAFSNIMQYIFRQEAKRNMKQFPQSTNHQTGQNIQQPETSKMSKDETMELMMLLGSFLLAIRRSLGNEATSFKELEMLRWFISDIDKYIEQNKLAS